MAHFNIFAFGTNSIIQKKIELLGYNVSLLENIHELSGNNLLFISPEKVEEFNNDYNQEASKLFTVLVGVPYDYHKSVNFILRDDLTTQELKIAIHQGKGYLLKQQEVDFELAKKELIVSLLSGNVHDVFSYLNNISARIQFLDMMVKDNKHVAQTSLMTIDQTKKITKILRCLQLFSKASMAPDDKGNIKVYDMLDIVLVLFRNKFIKEKVQSDIEKVDTTQYFTGCNTHILMIFIAQSIDLVSKYSKQNLIQISSAYSEDSLHLLFRFKPELSFSEHWGVTDFLNPELVNTGLFHKLMRACSAEIEVFTAPEEVQILLQFPKGV